MENNMNLSECSKRGNILYIVIPCYNEEEVLNKTYGALSKKISFLIDSAVISLDSKIVFVDDGSFDSTWEIIKSLHKKDHLVSGIKLSKNQGHQNALLAGIETIKHKADMIITIDADLQDNIDVIDKFIEKYNEGCEIVYGVRKIRKTDSFFKKSTAQGFYKFLKVMGVNIIYNHADFRLMSSRAIDELLKFKEVNLFLRGIVPLLGFKYGTVNYERFKRFAGKSKYSLKKMLSLAFDGITSFSIKPIRLVSALGVIIFTVSIAMLIYFLITHFIGFTVAGWTSIAVSVWAIGGLQLLAIGIIGEYIGKIYLETKSRPRFIIEEFLDE